MRLAWETAVDYKDFDFYIWLNDDTLLDEDAILHLFECYYDFNEEAIVVATCRNEIGTVDFSYGLKNDSMSLFPNGKIQQGKYMNGNCVLVDNSKYKKLGILSNDFIHGMGDYDYGLRAVEFGIELITTKKYIATCSINKGSASLV